MSMSDFDGYDDYMGSDSDGIDYGDTSFVVEESGYDQDLYDYASQVYDDYEFY